MPTSLDFLNLVAVFLAAGVQPTQVYRQHALKWASPSSSTASTMIFCGPILRFFRIKSNIPLSFKKLPNLYIIGTEPRYNHKTITILSLHLQKLGNPRSDLEYPEVEKV